MGLFNKLFGGAGSDKADKMRQAAIDAFNAIKTPDLEDLQVKLDHYVQTGRLTPEQAEAELLQSNAFNDIVTDPALKGAQKQALTALQEIGTQGGLTATDKARLQDITNEQNQVARGRNESILQSAKQRGMGSSDVTTVSQLLNEQASADRASNRGTQVAADAEARALQALVQAGQTAGQIRGQDYGEQAEKAKAANAIDLFNKQTLNQTNLYNVDAANKAQAANLANEQAISNANVNTTNSEKVNNANAHQTIYQDEMAKASGKAGVYNQWAGAADADNRAENAADMALLGGAVQGVATAFGGPAGAAATSGAGKPAASGGFDPNTMSTNSDYDYDRIMGYSEGGEVMSDDDRRKLDVDPSVSPIDMNCGGMVKNYENGGKVPGKAETPGNSPMNDKVPAKLSPGEVVIPRSAMSDDEEFDAFMEKFRPSKRAKESNGDPLMVQVLKNLTARVDNLEGR